MSELASVLSENAPAICDALGDRLGRIGCTDLMRDAADRRVLVDALITADEGSDPLIAEEWLSRNVAANVRCWQVLAVLGCLERIASFFVVKQFDNKRPLLAALNQLGDIVDVFRRCAVDSRAAEGSNVALPEGKDRQDAARPKSDSSVIKSRAKDKQPNEGRPTDKRSPDGLAEIRARSFAALVEEGSDFVYLADLQGKPFYFNTVARRLTGIADGAGPDEMPENMQAFHPEDYWEEIRDTGMSTAKRTGHWKGRGQLYVPKSDNLIDVETTMLAIDDEESGEPICMAVAHRDCGHLLRSQRALEESQARKTAILESSLDPIITIDHMGMITEFNKAAEKVFGRSKSEVLGTRPSEILFPAAKIAGYQNRIDRYLDAGEGSLLSKRNEVIAVRASGLPFEAELTMTINQERGNPVLTFFVRDISDRKRAEEEQQQYAQELEHSNRELEQFAYVASHDLQEPLRKICTFGDRLLTAYGDALDETGREYLERMRSATERMQALIKGLLSLSRITTRAEGFTTVDLAKVAGEVVSDLEVKIEQTGARVEVKKLPTIQADPLQMRQLLQNFIGNALKFRRPDVSPIIEVEAHFVNNRNNRSVGRSPKDEQCCLTVRDNGIGFDEKYLDRIFDVFQRLHPRDIHEGTGIGLAICRKIVERHGGTITAESAPGKGAKFIVMLPVVHRPSH